MGTVHGVYLKYVGLSALSLAGCWGLLKNSDGSKLPVAEAMQLVSRSLLTAGSDGSKGIGGSDTSDTDETLSFWWALSLAVLAYSAFLNALIAVLFKVEKGMGILGKDRKTGQIPGWSYLVFFPFHIPTFLYTQIHSVVFKGKLVVNEDGTKTRQPIPVATEVQPGWWVGGCHSDQLNKDWGGVIDLTVEFPESCINRTAAYLSLPAWDGVPARPEQLEEAAVFAFQASLSGGDVLVHCAHGRGRSTTVMCACLVKVGLYKNWLEAFEQGIKPQRPVCKLNRRMRQALQEWQRLYVDGNHDKKGQ